MEQPALLKGVSLVVVGVLAFFAGRRFATFAPRWISVTFRCYGLLLAAAGLIMGVMEYVPSRYLTGNMDGLWGFVLEVLFAVPVVAGVALKALSMFALVALAGYLRQMKEALDAYEARE